MFVQAIDKKKSMVTNQYYTYVIRLHLKFVGDFLLCFLQK